MEYTGRNPRVELLSQPTNIHGMLYYVWKASRFDAELRTPEQYETVFQWWYGESRYQTKEVCCNSWIDSQSDYAEIAADWELGKHVWETIENMVNEDIPVIEHASFVFEMHDVTVAWREQAARQRIGSKLGDTYLWDVITGAESSSFWSQTSRIIPDYNFVDEGRFAIPDSIKECTTLFEGVTNSGIAITATEVYVKTLKVIQNSIQELHEAGIPPEDSRMLSPAGKTHTISWAINLKALKHVFGKRTCFVMQAGIWEPVLTQLAQHLASVSPIFQQMLQPPCMSRGKFVDCPIKHTNENLITGEDTQPVCPLYLRHHSGWAVSAVKDSYQVGKGTIWHYTVEPHELASNADGGVVFSDIPGVKPIAWYTLDANIRKRFRKNVETFGKMWGFDPLKGTETNDENS